MSKRKKGNHGIYSLTCISQKCGRRFKVLYDIRRVSVEAKDYWGAVRRDRLSYPFTGCPWCGAWWCTGPLDASAYPLPSKKIPSFARLLARDQRFMDGLM